MTHIFELQDEFLKEQRKSSNLNGPQKHHGCLQDTGHSLTVPADCVANMPHLVSTDSILPICCGLANCIQQHSISEYVSARVPLRINVHACLVHLCLTLVSWELMYSSRSTTSFPIL